jgi:hypothetical protein
MVREQGWGNGASHAVSPVKAFPRLVEEVSLRRSGG